MKNNEKKRVERLVNALSLADDKYVDEALPDAVLNAKPTRIKRKNPNIKKIVLLAATLCLAFAILLTSVILPLAMRDSVSRLPAIDPEGADKAELSNDYATLLEKLAAYKLKNNEIYDIPTYDAETPDEEDGGAVDDETMAPTEDLSPSPEETYEETTDNQTDGVIESDIIKRSSKYIYYYDFHERVLRVYSIDGESSVQIGSFSFDSLRKSDTIVDAPEYFNKIEFFLSEDCKSVIFIAQGYIYTGERFNRTKYMTYIISLDVSDPRNITLKSSATLSGVCVESRYADERLLVVTSYFLRKDAIDLDMPETFLPQINGECVDSRSVYAPETIDNSYYTSVTLLDADDLDVHDTLSYISYYCNDIYASAGNLYIWRSYRNVLSDTEKCLEYKMSTEISAVSYSGGKLSHKGSVSVNGNIKDQYSLDEYNGVLRVFTSSYDRRVERYEPEDVPALYKISPSEAGFDRSYVISSGKHVFCFDNENANLFCIRVKDFEFIAEILEFAPKGENVKSARFDGNTAYVCTSIDFSDPVFFFDLSYLRNITYKDTGTIEGYSTSLIDLGDGLLLGIGYGDNRSMLKLEIYSESVNGVESVSAYEERASFSLEYKSYLIDRKNKLIGVPVGSLESQLSSGYLLFSYENGTLELVDFISVSEKEYGYESCYRALCIDGYIYVFANNGFFCVKKIG